MAADRRSPGNDRRSNDLGPPPGQPERRAGLRRASDTENKPQCPWCGSLRSGVANSGYVSKGDDGYPRRRQCAECHRYWPTSEGLDKKKFARQLRRQGKTLKDLGIE